MIAPFVPVSLVVAAVACLCFIIVNREFLLMVRRCAGNKAALFAIPLHMLHYASALAGFAWVHVFEYLPCRIRAAVSSGRARLARLQGPHLEVGLSGEGCRPGTRQVHGKPAHRRPEEAPGRDARGRVVQAARDQ
jgi:hypothetical protein